MWPFLLAGAALLLILSERLDRASSSSSAPVSDAEVIAVAKYAIAHETDPAVLSDLADKMHAVSPFPPAFYPLIVLLHNRAVTLKGGGDFWS